MIKVSEYGFIKRLDMARSFWGRGRYWTTAYYVDGLVVDTGCAHTAHELEEVLDDQPVNTIVNTHSHEDHIGGNGPLQRHREELTIFAHPLALDVLQNPRDKQPLQPYRKIFWGWPEASQADPISDGEVIPTQNYTFRVIYTPGHSPDHLCLYEPEHGWLFTGDLFVGGRDRALRAGYDIWEIIASLKQISNLWLTWMFPGSARVRQDPVTELHDKVSYLESLGERVLDLHNNGWDHQAIVRELCGGPMFIEFLTLGHFSRRQLILSYLSRADQQPIEEGK